MEKKKTIGIITQILLIAVFAFFTFSCATTYNGARTKAQLNGLQGQYISVALQRFGPASYITDDGQGGKIYVWSDNMGATTNTTGSTSYNRQYNYSISGSQSTTQTNYCERDIYVNADGIIYSWRYKGTQCE